MSATFDATTTSEYASATTAAARSALIVAALTGTISVKVFNGSNTEMGSGTMDTPWATASGDTVTVGEVTSFTVGTTATPDADWYIRFQNAGVTRWVRGSFGLSSSSQDFTWSLGTWTATHTGTIGTATIITSGNTAPAFTVAPTSASIAATGGTIQFTAVDPEGSTVTYSMTTRPGATISSTTGLVTVTSAAAGSSGNITVTASDGVLSTPTTCAVTVAASGNLLRFAPGHYTRPSPNTTLAQYQTLLAGTALSSSQPGWDSRIKGAVCLRYWKDFETSKGVYDWTFFDGLLAACSANNKKLMIRIVDHAFGTTNPLSAVPSYLQSEGLTYVSSNPNAGAATWRSDCLTYKLNAFNAIVDRYGEDSTLVGFVGEETAMGTGLPADYSATAFFNQQIRLMQELCAYAPKIPYTLQANYVTGSPTSMMESYYAAARTAGGVYMCGGPDMLLEELGDNPCPSQEVIRGITGGVNHIGTYLSFAASEAKDFRSDEYPPVGATPAQVYDAKLNIYQANVMSWSTVNSASQLAGHQWVDVFTYLATHPVNTTVPSALVGLVEVM